VADPPIVLNGALAIGTLQGLSRGERSMPARLTMMTAVLSTILTSVASADTTLVTTPLPGGTSAIGAYTLASVYGQATTLGTLAAGSSTLEPGFLCIEADDLGILGDLNYDGHVNGIDLAFVLSAWC
jgi:hypothetical protein